MKPIPAIVKQVEDEASLIKRINTNLKKGVETYRQIGEDLIRAKEQYGQHGKWMIWCKENIKCSNQRISQCVQLARKFLVTRNLTEEEKEEVWREIQGNAPEEETKLQPTSQPPRVYTPSTESSPTVLRIEAEDSTDEPLFEGEPDLAIGGPWSIAEKFSLKTEPTLKPQRSVVEEVYKDMDTLVQRIHGLEDQFNESVEELMEDKEVMAPASKEAKIKLIFKVIDASKALSRFAKKVLAYQDKYFKGEVRDELKKKIF